MGGRYHIKTLPDVENGQTCECGAPAVGIFPDEEPSKNYWISPELKPEWPKQPSKPYCRACLEKVRQDIMNRYSP